MRQFQSGSMRDSDTEKIDPEAALSPLVIQAYCEYVRKHRLQGSQEARGDDNWQLGIPPSSYMKSLWRHLLEAWKYHRGYPVKGTLNDALCAIIFNAQGMLHEKLKREYLKEIGSTFTDKYGITTTLINATSNLTEKYDPCHSRYNIPYGYDDGSNRPISTSSQKPLSEGEPLKPTHHYTKPASSPQPTIYPDDWPGEE